jgi:hypothetical protein
LFEEFPSLTPIGYVFKRWKRGQKLIDSKSTK